MARDGVFSGSLEASSAIRTRGALIFLGCVGIVLALSGTYEELYSCSFPRVDFLRPRRDRSAPLRKTEPNLFRLSRLGLPLDATYLFDGAIAPQPNCGSSGHRSSLGSSSSLQAFPSLPWPHQPA